MKKILKNGFVIFGLTVLLPTIISLMIKGSFSSYKNLYQPKLAPPAILFPIVWSVLYVLMSIAGIITKENDKCLKLYYIQLLLNIIWTPIFFFFNNYLLALVDLILLLICVIYMTYMFYKDNNKTIYLLVPYILWLLFALYLNYFIYLNN